MYHIIFHLIGLLVVANSVLSNENFTAEEILQKYRSVKLVPQKMRKAPPRLCHVQFKDFNLTIGRVVYRRDAKKEPKVTWDADPNSLYTLFVGASGLKFWDTEESSSDNGLLPCDWQQWVVVNIPGNNISAGQHVFPYIPPLIPDDVEGGDYYAFWIFKQNGTINVPKSRYKDGYTNYELSPVRNFSDVYLLGDPLFGNYLRIEWHYITTPPSLEAIMSTYTPKTLR